MCLKTKFYYFAQRGSKDHNFEASLVYCKTECHSGNDRKISFWYWTIHNWNLVHCYIWVTTFPYYRSNVQCLKFDFINAFLFLAKPVKRSIIEAIEVEEPSVSHVVRPTNVLRHHHKSKKRSLKKRSFKLFKNTSKGRKERNQASTD